MEIVAGKREGSNVSEAGCSKLPRVEDQSDVHTSLHLLEEQQPEDLDETEDIYETVASDLMEVFSVRFLNFDKTKLSQMYGCIVIRAQPLYVVFSRNHGEPLDIDSKGFIKLKDPQRVINPSDAIKMFPFLFKYDLSNHLDAYKGAQMWHYRSNTYGTLMSRRAQSQFSEIEVNYAVYMDGVAAHVDVTLTGCQFPSATPVHGLITAQNSELGVQGKSILFDTGDGKGCSVDVSRCKDLIARLPLARCKVALPLGSTLTIGLDILGTPDQEIAKDGELQFGTMLTGQAMKTFKGAACQVNVSVTWSHYKA